MKKEKQYIGDAVYIEVSDWGDVVLTTENGIDTTNRIVLEPQVMSQMMNYLELEYKSLTRS